MSWHITCDVCGRMHSLLSRDEGWPEGWVGQNLDMKCRRCVEQPTAYEDFKRAVREAKERPRRGTKKGNRVTV